MHEHPVLLAYGWVDYAHSSSNWAASQRGLTLSPPRIEAADGRGGWRLLSADMGRPAGLPKHMLFDLKDAFEAEDYRIHNDERSYILGPISRGFVPPSPAAGPATPSHCCRPTLARLSSPHINKRNLRLPLSLR